MDSVSITPEGLTFEGTGPGGGVNIPNDQFFGVGGSVTTSDSEQIDAGTYHSTFCPVGDFPYTELLQHQAGSYTTLSRMLGTPLALAWSLAIGTPQYSVLIPLTGQSGTITSPFPIATLYPTPVPSGHRVNQEVHIGYSITPGGVILTNDPTEGNYTVWLQVSATDPVGKTAEDMTPVDFTGDNVVMGGGFQQKWAQCVENLWRP